MTLLSTLLCPFLPNSKRGSEPPRLTPVSNKLNFIPVYASLWLFLCDVIGVFEGCCECETDIPVGDVVGGGGRLTWDPDVDCVEGVEDVG